MKRHNPIDTIEYNTTRIVPKGGHMNEQKIKRLLFAGIIALSICLLFTTQQNTQTQTVSGIISMEEVKITAGVGGNIKQTYHRQGDTVKRGDILYELDSPELTEEIEKAKNIITKVEDDLRVLSVPNTALSATSAEEIIYQQADAKAKQFQELYEQGAISKKMLIEAQTERDIAHQAVETARANGIIGTYGAGDPAVIAMKQEELTHARQNLETLEKQKQQLIITSPTDGIIANQIYQEGQRVESGYLIANIAVKENCTLTAYVSGAEKAQLAEGKTVAVKIGAYPDKQFSGTVTKIENDPKSDNKSAAVQIRMTNNDNLLRAGMQAQIQLD